jgi:hypothetical protein
VKLVAHAIQCLEWYDVRKQKMAILNTKKNGNVVHIILFFLYI